MIKQIFSLIALFLISVSVLPAISQPVIAAGTGGFSFISPTPNLVKTSATQFVDIDIYLTPTGTLVPFWAITAKLNFTETPNAVTLDGFTKNPSISGDIILGSMAGNSPANTNGGYLVFYLTSPVSIYNGQIKIGTLRFKVENIGTYELKLDTDKNNTFVLDANNVKFDPLDVTVAGTYTITAPTQAPSNITVTGLPTCISAALTATQKGTATVGWTSTSTGTFWVDISPNSSFSTFYHREVTTKSTDMTGLNLSDVYPVQQIEILSATPYYLRVTDQANSLTSAVTQIYIPACALPSPTPTPSPSPSPSPSPVPSFCVATTDYTTFYARWYDAYIQHAIVSGDSGPDCYAGDSASGTINILDLNKWRTIHP